MGFIKRGDGKIINIFTTDKDLDDNKKSSIKDSLNKIVKKSESKDDEDNKSLEDLKNDSDNGET